MLIVAHAGLPPAPHDVWSAWGADPLVLGALALAALLHRRGRRRGAAAAWRNRCFDGALLAVFVALVSPLDAVSAALASAHMVQHVLLIGVAAPLFALAAPTGALLRGSPAALRRAARGWRRLGIAGAARAVRHPVTAWLLHVATLWGWHAAVPYDAAVAIPAVHALEHATFVGTAVLFWRAVVGVRARRDAALGVLLVFAMGLQSVFLALLLTFATEPWYRAYSTTTQAWGLAPLADQQLAGAIMWVPAGAVHVAAGVALLLAWLRAAEADAAAREAAAARPSGGAVSLPGVLRTRQ